MDAPKIPSFIKTRYQFKRFSFPARYYDEDKERLETRKKAIENELKINGENASSNSIEREARMKMSMQDNWRNRRGSEYRKSNFRIALIVVILVVILYGIKQYLGL